MWSSGEVVTRREVLNDGRCWLEVPVVVVQDDDQLLATYIARGARLHVPARPLARSRRASSMARQDGWEGNGTLMLQRPGEAYAIWVFWFGAEREFRGWYVNFQEPFRRTESGYETQDLELDIWVPSTGRWEWKDADCSSSESPRGASPPSRSPRPGRRATASPACSTRAAGGGRTRGQPGRHRRAGTRRGRSSHVRCQTRPQDRDVFVTEVKRRATAAVQSSAP